MIQTTIKYPRAKPYFFKKDKRFIARNITKILNSGMLTQGIYVKKFEEEFASTVTGTRYAIATNSCTSALEIAIRSIGIKNKKILVPTQTFVASVNAIIMSGNIPVILDIDDTMSISADQVIDHVLHDSEVEAVLWVHVAGLISPKFEFVKSICDAEGVCIIEDAAHAHGATSGDLPAGSIGDVGCFSFYPTKIMAIGEGGMITTDNEQIARESRILRDHGTVRHDEVVEGLDYGVNAKYVSQNFRMTEMAAVVGLAQLRRLNKFVLRRNLIAYQYISRLTEVDEIQFIPQNINNINSYWNFYIVLNKYINREIFARSLLYDYGIQTANAYDPPCHKQKLYKQYTINSYPIADNLLKHHISLPMYYELSSRDIKYITKAIKKTINKITGRTTNEC